jgi:hypothetical protein
MSGGITYSIEFAASIARLLQNTEDGARGVKKMADDMESATKFVKHALESVVGALTVEHFASMILGANHAVAEFQRLSEVAGTTAETFSGFDVPARLAGTSLDTVASAVAKLGKSIGEARLGDAGKSSLLEALGIDPKGGEDAAAAMVDLAKAVSGMTDQTVAGYVTSQLLGKSFAELRPLMRELTDQGGLVARVTNEQAQAAKELADQFVYIKLNTDKMYESLARDLAPTLMQITQIMLETGKGGSAVSEVAAAIAFALKGTVEVGLTAIDVFYGIGTALGAVAAAAVTAAKGEFTAANQILLDANAQIEQHTADTNERVQKLWTETGAVVKKAMKPDGADDAAIASVIAEQHARELMEFNKHYEQRIAMVKGFTATYDAAIKTQNVLIAEAVKAGDMSEKDALRYTAQNEDARLQVMIKGLKEEEAIYKKKGELAKQQQAADAAAHAQAARLANEVVTKARTAAIDAAADKDFKQHAAKEVARIQHQNLTELQLLQDKLAQEESALDVWRGTNAGNEQQYWVDLANVYAAYENEKTRITDEETKKRYGIANVYRQLDFQSAGFFLGQMSEMMSSHNRAAFEVGKAAAIGKAIIDTIGAAQGSYNALAAIPIIGPFLGAAAAAAAIVAGIARVEQIKSTQFGGGGSAGSAAATPVFSANPVTGVPTAPIGSTAVTPPQIADAQKAQTPQDVHITFIGGEDKNYSYDEVATEIIPLINQAAGNGVNITVSSA